MNPLQLYFNSLKKSSINPVGNITYATWNSSDKDSNITLTNNNLTATSTNTSNQACRSTIGKSTGKWYIELIINGTIVNSVSHGIETTSESLSALCGATTAGYGYNDVGQKKYNNVDSSYGTALANGDILSILINLDYKQISWRRNNTNFGVAFDGLSSSIFYVAFSSGFGINSVTANFGASPFTYPVPFGYNPGLYDIN